MRKYIRYSGAAGFAIAAVALAPALHAQDGLSGTLKGSIVGSAKGQINITGMMGMGQMGSMMEQCSQMMQDRQGSSRKPNDQWRDDPPPAPGKPDKKR